MVRLVELARLQPDTTHLDLLADMNEFNLAGRYPGQMATPRRHTRPRSFCGEPKKSSNG